ncbi:protein OSB1, mitochondrial-like isoform X1 [Vicia villosa]|uniref:protein OSB1, mitochondrial-like isoform X1 n=1 Tax=Vicia villosa TaxID=3911 RepID=UPI00273CA7C8|nr:protein OSB1, mitochondrial-like isoform X1 [Vicia villosa]
MKLKPFYLRSFFFSPKLIQTPFTFSNSSYKCFSTNHTRKPPHCFDDAVPGTSAVYNHALKFQRPPTIKWKPHLENTTTFIGSVTRELKRVNSNTFGFHTTIRVRSSNKPNSSSFWVLLMMWNDVAEFAYQHVKPNHFICVSGCLATYDGERGLCYKLIVNELEFVTQSPGYGEHEKEIKFGAGNQLSDGNQLHLWQVFFASPNEWWDRRKNKLNPNSPDFKHKDTGEALWLSKHNPPWVTRQLELLDLKFSGGFAGRRPRLTSWVYDE